MRYPPPLQACIPALFLVGNCGNTFEILLYGASKSIAELTQIRELDKILLNMRTADQNDAFSDFFRDKSKSRRYHADPNAYLALATQIFRVIRPE
jgi:hypothetical protein